MHSYFGFKTNPFIASAILPIIHFTYLKNERQKLKSFITVHPDTSCLYSLRFASLLKQTTFMCVYDPKDFEKTWMKNL